MYLGKFFPNELKSKSIRDRLKPGAVIKHEAVMDDGAVHEKRFVVVSVTEKTVTCVINTKLSNYILARPYLKECQVPVAGADREFLDHDSYIDCSNFRIYSTAEVVEQLLENPGWIYGYIDEELRAEIISKLHLSDAIAPVDLKKFCSDLIAATLP